VFGAVVCGASYPVIDKKLTGSVAPKRITSFINLLGFALMTPMELCAAWSCNFGAVAAAIPKLDICGTLAPHLRTSLRVHHR